MRILQQHARPYIYRRPSPRPWASDRGHGLQHLRRGRIRRLYGKRTDAIYLRLLGWRWLLRLRCLTCLGAAPTFTRPPGDGRTYSPSLFVRVFGRCSAQRRWIVVTLTSSTPECPSRNPASLASLEKMSACFGLGLQKLNNISESIEARVVLPRYRTRQPPEK